MNTAVYVEIVTFPKSGSDEMCVEYEIHTDHKLEVLFHCTTSVQKFFQHERCAPVSFFVQIIFIE